MIASLFATIAACLIGGAYLVLAIIALDGLLQEFYHRRRQRKENNHV